MRRIGRAFPPFVWTKGGQGVCGRRSAEAGDVAVKLNLDRQARQDYDALMASWQLQDAKNRFSAVVNAALAGEPQQVTRRGEPVVVVVSVDEYERLRKGKPEDAPTFVEHLLAIPQGGDFDFERLPLKPRDIDF